MINVSKINHRGESRIKIQFEKSAELIRKVKSIEGRKWSQTKKCWHLPYSSESFQKIKLAFGEHNLILPKSSIILKPKLEVEFATYWVGKEKRRKVVGEKIIVQQKNANWLKVFVPVDKIGWTEVLRNINGRRWDPEMICWEIPNVKQSYRLLKKFIGLNHIQFDFKIKKEIPEEFQFSQIPKLIKKKKNVKLNTFELLNQHQKNAIHNLLEQMTLGRLRHSTMRSYRNHLISIFLFHKNIHPVDLTSEQIQQYILHQIKFKKISESTQNVIINSVKAYWEKVLKYPPTKIEIPRPKKPKHLPNVFSQEEVIRLIEAPKNLKHKLILLLIYSAGLRLSEVINIRVRDISLGRRVIFIKDGKGKKDRFVTLAEEVIPYLNTYKTQYKPDYWLLEGQSGGQYSKRSVQNIFHKALKDSKVYAYGTVHTLRHSYATHCIENGYSTALLQEALGHGSIKTTEKYLHISSKALKKLSSPLDIIKDSKRKQS
jgi:site-specific recombinase XerD